MKKAILIPEDLHALLRQRAASDKVTMYELAEKLLREALKTQGGKRK